MKELRKKTMLTVFFMLSAILIAVLVFVNVRNYAREEEGIRRSLDILEDRRAFRNGRAGEGEGMRPEDVLPPEDTQGPEGQRLRPHDLENMMIMDYEIYTAELKDGAVAAIYDHGNASEDFDAARTA